jgi:hypothetical protein
MPGMTRPATARRQEDALLGRPRQAALLTAGVAALTAVVSALAADPRPRHPATRDDQREAPSR